MITFIIISEYANGANFDASDKVKERISKKWANVPIAAREINKSHWDKDNHVQKKGTIKEITIAPVKPVKIKVIKGLSIADSFRVLIT